MTALLPLAVIWALIWIEAAAQTVGATPLARVEMAVEEVIAILREQGSSREDRWARIATVVERNFDFQSMSQSVLSTNWKRATLEERRRFTEYFSQYIETTFRSQIEAYTDQRIAYLDERIIGDRGDLAVVNTEVVSGKIHTPVTYKLRRNEGGEWLAYDVVIEGVSLVANYRNTFAAIVKTEGMDGLIADVQRRIEKHKASGQGGAK